LRNWLRCQDRQVHWGSLDCLRHFPRAGQGTLTRLSIDGRYRLYPEALQRSLAYQIPRCWYCHLDYWGGHQTHNQQDPGELQDQQSVSAKLEPRGRRDPTLLYAQSH
jgi:hypothetical protein